MLPIQPNGLAWANTLKNYGAGIRLIERPNFSVPNGAMVQILLNDPNRVFWLISNLSNRNGAIAFNGVFTGIHGIPLSALGGFITMSVAEDGEAVTYPVWGVSNFNAVGWYVLELVQA